MRPGIKAKSTAPWKTTTLGQVLKWSSGGTPKSTMERYYNGGIPWAIIGDLNDGIVTETAKTISEEGLKNSSAKWVEEGSVLIAMYGSIGKLGIAGRRMTTNQAIAFTKPECCSAKYLFWYLYYSRAALLGLGKGGTQANISQTVLKAFPFVLPSEDEQRRIVGEIEKQFSRLEEGVEALKRVQVNLKRYRAAVLKAACEGRLVPTEAERQRSKGRGARGGGKYETGAELLARILAERRKNWQGKGPYKEPAPPNTAKLGSIPTGWIVASLEQLTSPDRPICYGILMPKENVPNGVLFVTVKDMKGDKIDLDSLRRTAPEIAMKYARASLKTGDLLLSIRGTYGRVAEVPKELDGGNITQDTARLDVTRKVSHRYIATYLRNPDCQQFFKRVARGVAVKGVNIGDVRPAPIPLPPLAEQLRIVAEVERRLSVVEELEATVEANLQRATRLRQSILQKAFAGKLV